MSLNTETEGLRRVLIWVQVVEMIGGKKNDSRAPRCPGKRK